MGKEETEMATESFLRDVTIKKSSAKRRLIKALENAHKNAVPTTKMSRTVEHLSRDKIRDFFGNI